MYKILFCGTSLSGNADGRAILDTLVEGIQKQIPEIEFTMLCKYPKDDLPLCKQFGHKAHSLTTLQQMGFSIPFYCVGSLWKKLGLNPQKLPMPKSIRSYFQHDIMIDLTGISFCDDRPFSSLIINTLWFLPALVTKISMVKIANSMGPFEKWYVKFGANLVLPKVDVLIARGDISYKLTKEFLPKKEIYNLPDVAFCLSPCSTQRRDQILDKKGLKGKKYAILGPSYVVNRLAGQSLNMDVYLEAATSIRLQSDIELLLVPHSRAHSATLGVDSSSDDVNVCFELQKVLKNYGIHSNILDDILDAHELKGVIGGAEFVIGSRYHLLVASLSSGVPSLALGWSHKYKEMFKMFGCDQWVITYEHFSRQGVAEKTKDFYNGMEVIRKEVNYHLPEVLEESNKHIPLICELLESRVKHER